MDLRRLGWVLLLCSCDGALIGPMEAPDAAARDAGNLADDGGAIAPYDAGSQDAGTPDSGTVDGGSGVIDSGAPDASVLNPAGIPMFVAIGHLGRTTLSCDDGKSWVADQSANDAGRCYTNGLDCDHSAWSVVGNRSGTYGNGWFFASSGWGPPGMVRRSRDGISWEKILDQQTFAGVAYLDGKLVAASGSSRNESTDDGKTWTIDSVPQAQRGIRALGGGLLATFSDLNIAFRQGNGSWFTPQMNGGPCNTADLAAHGSTVLLLDRNGGICRSTDGAKTFTRLSLLAPGEVVNGSAGAIRWTGSQFFAWDHRNLYRSPDGQSWTRTALNISIAELNAFASADNGTYVAVGGGWDGYGTQQFFRSTDGLNWTALPPTAFVKGHPITAIVFGYGAPSAACPGP
jgi:hypothetical protein